jgi:hypothetical protein
MLINIKPKNHYLQYADLFVITTEEQIKCQVISESNGVTNSSHIAGDPTLSLNFFDMLWPYAYPKFHKLIFPTKICRYLARDGIINVGLLLEKAISKKGKLKRDSTHGRDFVDLSDAKSVSVRLRDNGDTYSANVTNIKAKQGALRVLCYERVLKKFYFFIIPADFNPGTSIEIPFELNGSPKRTNHWWNHEVLTFEELCRPIP